MLMRRAFLNFQGKLALKLNRIINSQKPNLSNKLLEQKLLIENIQITKPYLSSCFPYSFTTSKKPNKTPNKKVFKLKKTQLIPG